MDSVTKRILLAGLLVAATVFPSSARAQTDWEIIDTKVTPIQDARPTFVFNASDWISIHPDGGYLYLTADGGETWEERRIERTGGVLSGIHFFDMENGIAFRGNNQQMQPLLTSDGGQTWETPESIFPRLGTLFDMSIVDRSTMFAWSAMTVYRTDDGGNAWSAVPETDGIVADFVALDGETFFLAMDAGFNSAKEFRTSTDAGATWNVLHTFDRRIVDFAFFSRQNVVLQTDIGFWASADGGQTWTESIVPEDVNMHVDREASPGLFETIDWVNSTTGFIGGRTNRNHGYFMRTDDAGETWTEVPLPQEVLFAGSINFITHVPGEFIMVVTSEGLAARSGLDATNTAVQEADAGPEQFTLSAAYPNPFNPLTQFDLTVDQPQNVRVAAYDLLGREVKMLFEGMMRAGQTQTVRFDAGFLPSGSYLVRVQGAHFSASRSVILLK